MTDKPIQVVVAFDFTDTSTHALAYAVDLARRSVRRVFHFVCILDERHGIAGVPQGHETGYLYAEKVQLELTQRIEKAFEASQVPEAVQFFVHARFGDPAPEILVLARGVGAHLVVLGGKTVAPGDTVTLGAVVGAVLPRAACNIVVARPRGYDEVELLQIQETEPTKSYVPPHRYSYEETRVIKRPPNWPLY
ncbi:MAG: universal stress protein [Deltaproteobacteria bacterium]